MIGLPGKYLLFHGSIVLLAGLFSGVLFWLAIIRGKGGEAVRAWRVAHSVLVVDGLMMLIAGLIIPHVIMNEKSAWMVVLALITSGYGFVFAFIVGAWKGIRGLTPKPYGFNTVLFGGHMIGAVGSLIGIAILIYGLFRSL